MDSSKLLLLFTFTITLLANHHRSASYPLNNRFHDDDASIAEASNDYGNIVHNKPSSILDPASHLDIVRLMKNPTLKSIAARGFGHSVRGQDMAPGGGGVVVNMTTLSSGSKNRVSIGRGKGPSSYYADVGAELLWSDVLRETLRRGFAPLSWTDYLYLTVGGTLSNAGIGGQTFLHGPQVANVLRLEVVTGKGDFVICSPRKNSEIFYGALGGLGQFGIITRARIVVSRAPKMARWATLIYTDFSKFSKDQEHLISSTNASSYVEGFLIVNMSIIDHWKSSGFPISDSSRSRIAALLRKHGVLYSIELAKYHDIHQNTINQEFDTLVEKLNFIPGLGFIRDATFFDFLHRVKSYGNPGVRTELVHPWVNLFIAKSGITDFNKHVLAGMLPRLNQTSSPFVFYPVYKNKWSDKMSVVTPELTPTDEGKFYIFELLHSVPQDDYQRIQDFNNELLNVCQKLGINAKHYLAYFTTQAEWKEHFGRKWETFLARKRMFDPNNKLSPGQQIFNRLGSV